MSRTKDEWIGKTDDTAVPPRVRLRVFKDHGGICHISGRKITPADKWEIDHVIRLEDGGPNRETNLAPALRQHHKVKSAAENKQQAKDDRIRKKHLGIKTKKTGFQLSKRFKRKVDGTVVERD